MILYLSRGIGWGYGHLVKPLLFRQSPDIVHERMVKSARIFGAFTPAVWLMRRVLRTNATPLLSQTIHGIPFPNPVGLSAGLDKNAELLPLLPAIGFGFGTVGSVTHQVCVGNPRPWFYRLPRSKSLVVHVGLANHGAAKVIERLNHYHTSRLQDFPVVVSVAKTNNPTTCNDTEAIADYIGSLKLLQNEPRAAVLEINISCPNTYGGEPFTDPVRLDALLAAVDALHITKPVWVKMPINHAWPEFNALLKIIIKHRVQGVTIGNLSKQRSEIPSEELPSQVKGNLSGLPTQALSDNLIAKTYSAYGSALTIIGVGGIFTAEDAYRKITLGASLVELITGLIYTGPQLPGQLNRDLAKLAAQDGFKNIAEAVGSGLHVQNGKKPV